MWVGRWFVDYRLRMVADASCRSRRLVDSVEVGRSIGRIESRTQRMYLVNMILLRAQHYYSDSC